jgi:nucleoside-diphosphate-sugar epimerase
MGRPKLFCFGFGFTARAVRERLTGEVWRFHGTNRSGDADPAAVDVAMHAFSRDRPLPNPSAALAETTHLLASIPPDDAGDPVLDGHADAIAAIEGLRWVGYLSATSVYGDRDGGWVDEETPTNPTSERGRRRLRAETAWLDLWRRRGVPVHIVRPAGIYGPGRSALDNVRAGRAERVGKPGHVFSRIHVADLADILIASMRRPRPGAVYNAADDEPSPPQDVVLYACRLLDLAPPPEVSLDAAALSPAMREFYAESRRVSNGRVKRELGVRFSYPDYRAGLDAIGRAIRR